MTFRRGLAVVSLTLGLALLPVSAVAQSNEQLSPTTQNPQTDVSGNLQPTGSGLQPTTGNSSQTPEGSQQALLSSSTQPSLKVLDTTTPTVNVQGTNTTTTSTTTTTPAVRPQKSSSFLWIIIPVVGLGFLGVMFWQFSHPKKRFL